MLNSKTAAWIAEGIKKTASEIKNNLKILTDIFLNYIIPRSEFQKQKTPQMRRPLLLVSYPQRKIEERMVFQEKLVFQLRSGNRHNQNFVSGIGS